MITSSSPKTMTSREIRSTFLDFFAAAGHRVVASSPLLPSGDSTLLFANAGMNQFKDVFAGREARDYSRACSSQKCVRAGGKHNDLENVGYTARHHTFFEMLGNFSFGDYFKRDAIKLAWDLVTEGYGLPVERLWFTVYTDDDEAFALWQEVGAPAERILRFGEKDNYWAMGETGPCGPCSEIHYDRGPDPHAPGRGALVNGPGDDIMEIWNLVFMQFDRDADGTLHPLPRPSIDTGMGLERVASILQNGATNYDTDLFRPLIAAIGRLAERRYDPTVPEAAAFRVIADHIRATTFLMSDGIVPSNEGRGYVLRRIIRRALRYGRKLGLDGAFLHTLLPTVVAEMGDVYPELGERQAAVATQLKQEEERFARTLNAGTDVAQRELDRLEAAGADTVPGKLAFDLYQTHGIPVELLEEFAQEEGLGLDHDGYQAALDEERERGQASWRGGLTNRYSKAYEALVESGVSSRFIGYDSFAIDTTVSALIADDGLVASLAIGGEGEAVLERTPFYAESGGQVGDRGDITWPGGRAEVSDTQKLGDALILHSIRVVEGSLARGAAVTARVGEGPRRDTQRNHTATHLLHAALRSVLGPAAQQAGSLVEPERLRFDFSWGGPVSAEQLVEIERLANLAIIRNEEVSKVVTSLDAARALGAMALFGEKYGDQVRVVTVGEGDFSRELCGGCHVERTGDIGYCAVVSERGVAAGVRRLEAVTGRGAIAHVQHRFRLAAELAAAHNTSFEQLPELLAKREGRLHELEDEVKKLRHQLASGGGDAAEQRTTVGNVEVVTRRAPEMDAGELRNLADTLRQRLGSGVVVLGMESGGKATLLVAVTADVEARVPAGEVVKRLAAIVGGRGGGRPNLAQAGGPDAARLSDALAAAPGAVAELIGG